MISPICWFQPGALWHLEPSLTRKAGSIAAWSLRRLCSRLPGWRRELLALCDRILPNSNAEARQLSMLFGVNPDRMTVVPNGVLSTFRGASPALFRERFGAAEFVLFVGRLEPRKNPLGLIRAVRALGLRLVVLGAAPPECRSYIDQCRAAGGSAVDWMGSIDHEDRFLASAYAAARVMALPSWFETPGLAALEASLAGTAVVITPFGSTREYFGDRVLYARPDRLGEIKSSLARGWTEGADPRLAGFVAAHYLWPRLRKERRRCMTRWPGNPRPISTGRYRYSKLRWRIMVHALDAVGTVAVAAWRLLRKPVAFAAPERVLIVQLDHLGDSVLTSPLIARLRAAYPAATIDVLASPSNHEVFEADPGVNRVRIADRTWFERHPGRWGLLGEVWRLGRSIRSERYDLGIDVRGDVLSVLVLALGGIPRRVGWAMGGGSFLLTDIADWVRGRHEVRARLALLEPLGMATDDPPRAEVHVSDEDRAIVGRCLSEAWPKRSARRLEVPVGTRWRRGSDDARERRSSTLPGRLQPYSLDADRLHAGRFGPLPPLLAVHLGAGTAAKRWPLRHWKTLVQRFLQDGWRVVVVGGSEDPPAAEVLPRHDRLRDLTGRLTVTQTTALLERADLFIGADSGPAHLAASAGTLSVILFSGTNQPHQWRPWSRHSMILRHRVPCHPCHQKTCPLADHPCMAELGPDRVFRAARRCWARFHQSQSPHNPI